MQYVPLGRIGLRVSRLGLGTMNFGPQIDETASFRVMDRAHELGINFFDTADVYGWKKGEGVTEQIVGRWLAQGGGRREKTVIATKLYGEMGDWPNTSRLSGLWIRRACEGSLKRLRTDYIDLYQMHHVWREAPWDEIWPAFERLVQQGKLLYIGSSNFAGWHIVQANETARQRHFLGLVSEQCKYNLLHRMVELEVLPACRQYGLGVLPWSPLAGGLLAGDVAAAAGGRRSEKWVREGFEKHRRSVESFWALCREIGQKPADVALAWVLASPAVTAPIIGPRTIEQLDDSARALELKLSDDTMKKLDGIFPGPGGAAPEAWAW